MSSSTIETVQPGAAEIAAAVAALPRVRGLIEGRSGPGTVRLNVEGSPADVVEIPRAALQLLAKVLTHLASGQGVSVVPASAELTTQQAADLLNVSRPYVIGLLDAGHIDYRLVGRHRRIRMESILAYRNADDRRRSAAADELTALNQDMGLG